MGSLTVNEVLKLLKALDKNNVLKKKKRKKRKYNKKNYNNSNNIKSISDHMKGNIITGEHLRAIQDNYNIKNKAYENSINDFKNQGIKYLQNHENRLYDIENKNNVLSSKPNQSLTRENVKKYSNSNDNFDVVTNNPDFHVETSQDINDEEHEQDNDEIPQQKDNNYLSYFTNWFTPKKNDTSKEDNNDNRQFVTQKIDNPETTPLTQNIKQKLEDKYNNDDNETYYDIIMK